MTNKRVAIACQGGGSQCAFVAGALKALLEQGVQREIEIVGLSGTSGGALTAAMAWQALLKQEHGDPAPPGDAIVALWKDLTAQTPQEIVIDKMCLQLQRLVEHGLMPSLASSPSSLSFLLWSRAITLYVDRP
jgi:NTE family protein